MNECQLGQSADKSQCQQEKRGPILFFGELSYHRRNILSQISLLYSVSIQSLFVWVFDKSLILFRDENKVLPTL